jgi:hypothetical protein
MPNSRDHLNKAKHNEDFYLSLNIDTTPFLDWVVNGVFYSALHYVDSYFAMSGDHPGDHFERNNLIHADRKLGRGFYKNFYRPLKDDSNEGRYDVRTFTPHEIRNDIIPLLKGIKQYLKQYVTEIITP